MNNELKILIDEKAKELGCHADIGRDVSDVIKKLNSHISGSDMLDEKDIYEYLNLLIGFFTTSLEMSLGIGQKIIRGRVFGSDHKEKLTQGLSYIPDSKKNVCPLGRLNKKGEPIFYGCLYFDEDVGGVNLGFSETRAKTGEVVNMLRSVATDELKIYFLGIYDFVHRQQKPWFITDKSFAVFQEVYDYQKSKYTEELFVAHLLCDAFFSDVYRRKGNDNLYQITSQLANFIIKDTSADGLIYGSVESEGSPLIAIRTSSVDRKVTHKSAEMYKIVDEYGYGFFKANMKSKGVVSGASIIWTDL